MTLRGGNIGGDEAISILLQEIGREIGPRRMRELDLKVRAKMLALGLNRRGFRDWLGSIATVIVDDGDTKADKGFQRGVRRIKATARNRQ